MYPQSYTNQQLQYQDTQLKEQDWGNLVLSELKRTAREYTTAALEASHPAIRQSFQSLAQHTMQDQAELFDVLSQLNGYGSIKAADQQDIQQELQQHFQKAEQLQAFVQKSLQRAHMGAGMYQQASIPGYSNVQSYRPQAQASMQSGYGTAGAGQAYGSQYQSSGQAPSYNAPGQTQGYGITGGSSQSYGSFAGSSSMSGQDYSTGKYSGSFGASYTNTVQGNSNHASSAARGGNSFDWHAEEEDSPSVSLQSGSTESSGKNFM